MVKGKEKKGKKGKVGEKSRLAHRFRWVDGAAAEMELEAAKILVQYQRNLYSCLVWDEPENVVWTNMVMPTELFYACGLIPLHAEMTGGMDILSASGRRAYPGGGAAGNSRRTVLLSPGGDRRAGTR